MRFGEGGVGERAGCCGLKSALRGARRFRGERGKAAVPPEMGD
jgi:hypothetical protein